MYLFLLIQNILAMEPTVLTAEPTHYPSPKPTLPSSYSLLSGTINLTEDNGWSEMGSACFGYIPTTNFTTIGEAAGFVDVQLSVAFNVSDQSEYYYEIVFYDDQNGSYPMVNNTYLSCNDKVSGNYARFKETIHFSSSSEVEKQLVFINIYRTDIGGFI